MFESWRRRLLVSLVLMSDFPGLAGSYAFNNYGMRAAPEEDEKTMIGYAGH
jgi:hypothetical protein